MIVLIQHTILESSVYLPKSRSNTPWANVYFLCKKNRLVASVNDGRNLPSLHVCNDRVDRMELRSTQDYSFHQKT